MDLKEGREHLSQHMGEAHRRASLPVTLVLVRREYHRRADEAWAKGDVIEHRIWSMAANEVAIMLQQLPPGV